MTIKPVAAAIPQPETAGPGKAPKQAAIGQGVGPAASVEISPAARANAAQGDKDHDGDSP